MSNERRRRTRLPSANLTAKVRVKQSFFSSIWQDVRPFDFNVLGVGLKTTQDFEKGDHITLSFNLDVDMGSVAIDEVVGIVKHIDSRAGLNSYGIEFDQSAKPNKKTNLKESLERIEDLLNKHNDIVNRLG